MATVPHDIDLQVRIVSDVRLVVANRLARLAGAIRSQRLRVWSVWLRDSAVREE